MTETDAGAVKEKTTPKMRWNDDKMESSFANVVNVQSTREQVDLFFGVNQTWNLREDPTVQVDLLHRIMLSPLAAKRLSLMLNSVLREHEARHGTLDLDR
ncbi:DUF3467 domain-containing protein [Fluviibacterium sp. DFM31]|uniref:DUF3467 domain-containing protein n=1 Tax=Meridianimarinicoccus marinus TaxID=3231483 RepID=A0ABV3L3M1_9RHOB